MDVRAEHLGRTYVDDQGVRHRIVGIATDLLIERDDGFRSMWTRSAFALHFKEVE